MSTKILCIVGPTASGKSGRAVAEALAHSGPNGAPFGGEVISVDSRQVYRGLDIGTEKISREEMQGVPHHLIDIRDAGDPYSAGDFATDAARLIEEIAARGKLPILAGGSHFYFDALLSPLPAVPIDEDFRDSLEGVSTEELYARVGAADARRAAELDPHNRRRIIRALEIIHSHGSVSPRIHLQSPIGCVKWIPEWIVIDPSAEVLRQRIDARLASALDRGLINEVVRVRTEVGDVRLNELGLEYRVVGEYLRGERTEESLLPALSAKLWQYARRQKAWLRKLAAEHRVIAAAS